MADDADAPEPATCTFTPDELDVPESMIDDLEACSRPVWEGADARWCVWHAERTAKPPAELAATVEDGALSGARVRESDLTRGPFPEASTLVGAHLGGADLRAADLRNTTLAGTTLDEVSLARSTRLDAPVGKAYLESSDPRVQDMIARANHELRVAYSENGLTGRARRARVRERNARRKEAFAEESW